MIHIAARSRSLIKAAPFTSPGLGDRLHSAHMAYNYGKAHGQPVTLHLTDDKWSRSKGSTNDMKSKSWNEIVELFPEKALSVMAHEVENLPEEVWIDFLKRKGIDAETYFYKDGNFKFNYVPGLNMFNASKYLTYPSLPAEARDIDLPEKFVTAQFDSNNVPYWKDDLHDSRKIPYMDVNMILNRYTSLGYSIVFIGGDAEIPELRGAGNLKNIAFALSQADYHLGTDSGLFHLANIYMKPSQIKLFTRGWMSHHTQRAAHNGVKVEVR